MWKQKQRNIFSELKTRGKNPFPLHLGNTKLLLLFRVLRSTSCAGTGQGGDSGATLPGGERKKRRGRDFSGRFREKGARAPSAGSGRCGTRWRCRTESRSLGDYGDGKRRHRILSFVSFAGNARWRQPLVPDIKTSGEFPREGGARTGTERRPSGLGAEAPGGASGSCLVARASPRRERGSGGGGVREGRGLAMRVRTFGDVVAAGVCVFLHFCMFAGLARRKW